MRYSIIIPTLDEAATLPTTLARLGAALKGCAPYELIVADGGSTDGTVAVATGTGCRVVRTGTGRARQLNAGAAAARGDNLFFLHADTLVPQDFHHYLDSELPASFRLAFQGDHRSAWLRLFGWCSRFSLGAFRYGDQGLLVSAVDFRAVGGYREELRLFEDHDLVRRLTRYRGGFRVLPATVVTSARRYESYGVVFTQSVYVLLYLLYRLGTTQDVLAGLYQRAFRLPELRDGGGGRGGITPAIRQGAR